MTKINLEFKKVILDTNILITVFSDIGKQVRKKTDFYSKELGDLFRDSKCKVLLPTVVISEFFNKFMKEEFKRARDNGLVLNNMKEFRRTEQYKESLKLLRVNILPKFLKKCVFLSDSGLSTGEIEGLLSKASDADFTDLVIAALANKHGAQIMSDDKDILSLVNHRNVIYYQS